MSILTLMNFLVGPLGKSFKIIKEQGKLFVEEDFTELNESQYSLYRAKIGESEQKIYCIGYDEESKEFEVVNEDEKEALLTGSRFIRETVGEDTDQPLPDSELIDKFASVFDFLMK
jgi:hypothetical protein